MSNARIVLCETCGGEGRLFTVTHSSREDGGPDGYIEPCPWCEGSGGEISETQPIELDVTSTPFTKQFKKDCEELLKRNERRLTNQQSLGE